MFYPPLPVVVILHECAVKRGQDHSLNSQANYYLHRLTEPQDGAETGQRMTARQKAFGFCLLAIGQTIAFSFHSQLSSEQRVVNYICERHTVFYKYKVTCHLVMPSTDHLEWRPVMERRSAETYAPTI